METITMTTLASVFFVGVLGLIASYVLLRLMGWYIKQDGESMVSIASIILSIAMITYVLVKNSGL